MSSVYIQWIGLGDREALGHTWAAPRHVCEVTQDEAMVLQSQPGEQFRQVRSIEEVDGIGETRAEQLAIAGLYCLEELAGLPSDQTQAVATKTGFTLTQLSKWRIEASNLIAGVAPRKEGGSTNAQ